MTPLPGFVGRDKLPPEISWCPIRSQGRWRLWEAPRGFERREAGLGFEWEAEWLAGCGLYATVRLSRYFICLSLCKKMKVLCVCECCSGMFCDSLEKYFLGVYRKIGCIGLC